MKEVLDENKIVYIQSVMLKGMVNALKEKTHETSVKDAISKAIYHYLKCECNECREDKK